MDWQGWLSLALVAGVLGTLTLTRLKPHVVMMGALTVLITFGVLTGPEALAGFANEGLITVAAMFVVAAGINASGGAELIVTRLLGRPKKVRAAMWRMFSPVAVLSGFLNNTPVVATMIPAVNSWSRKTGIAPSKLMIPLSYASILGGTTTLIGTSTNLVLNGQYRALTGEDGFSLFSITAVGLPVALLGLLFMWLFFPRLLPDRKQNEPFANMREFTLEVAVATGGPLVDKTIEEAGLRHLVRVYLVEIERDGTIITAVPSEERLRGGDRLVFAGDTDAISDLLRINGIVPSEESDASQPLLTDRAERRLVEAVVSPHCEAVGHAIRDARFRDRYGAAVLAVARNGERIKGNLGTIELEAGDTLLLEARPAFVTRQRYNKDFLLINDLDTEQPRHDHMYMAWAILLGLVLAAGFGLISMLNAALLGAAMMLVTGCCSVHQAEKSLDLTVLITIGASFALGAALDKSGAAVFLATNIIDLSGGRPWLILVLTYMTVSLLTETITNNAAAILMLPVVLGITASAGLNPTPFIFAIMMGASASFATPLGYQTNLMVYGPGGYTFLEFMRVGIPMNIFIGCCTLTVLMIGWPLEKLA
ncbi:SLC13 family permease [Haliea sp. E1-2-M8]|uniref:SLC13 family permease n=1 Tax=Haliea sp. E1-2-M8 TaxID=3064706 RepID=UPI002728113F|nr:SLC13 family permease [Haliea sp. E1-2-M8]MDO8860916.1 SLC13 family permease [Haliea sp. E1-2-M8]